MVSKNVRKLLMYVSNLLPDRWLHSVVPKMIDLKKEDFMHLLHKLLFLETADQYCNKDNWPPEADRSFMVRVFAFRSSTYFNEPYLPILLPLLIPLLILLLLLLLLLHDSTIQRDYPYFKIRLASEAPLLEDTLMRILVLGHGSSGSTAGGGGNGPNANEALDLVERMVKRAALVGVSFMNVVGGGNNANVVPTSVLKMERLTIFETLLNLCAYQVTGTLHFSYKNV